MAADAAAQPRSAASRLPAALKDAAGTALLTLALAVPIIALRTEQNISNELVLQPRWGYVLVAVVLAFVARLLYLLVSALPKRVRETRASSSTAGGSAESGDIATCGRPSVWPTSSPTERPHGSAATCRTVWCSEIRGLATPPFTVFKPASRTPPCSRPAWTE